MRMDPHLATATAYGRPRVDLLADSEPGLDARRDLDYVEDWARWGVSRLVACHYWPRSSPVRTALRV